jgi:UPF0716 protein FxsA
MENNKGSSVRYLLTIFILMPVLEIWVLINVGSQIGALATIALVFLTALIGVGLLREQGFDTLLRGREKLESGEMPASEMVEGLILAVSGALLLTPGFITDVIGFLGLARPTRLIFANKLMKNVMLSGLHKSKFREGNSEKFGGERQRESGDIIDGEAWERKDLE